MKVRKVDVAIIGAGTAGLAAFHRAREETSHVLLIEGGAHGTTCARVGCMPSKLLIAAANTAHGAMKAPEFGVGVDNVRVDGMRVMERVRRYRDEFVGQVVAGVEEIPEAMRLCGTARFVSDDTLVVTGDDGVVTVKAKAIVIATGSAPMIPDAFAAAEPDTSDSLFDWSDLPSSVALFGNGIIGLELGQALARLGVKVRVFGKDGLVGPLTDEAVLAVARNHFCHVMDFVPDYEMTSLKGAGVHVTVDYRQDGGDYSGTFERILVAVGRTPNVDGLGLEATSLELDDAGVPLFDRATGQCGSLPIYIAGDAMDDAMLLHEASDTGRIAGANAAGRTTEPMPRAIALSVMFCEPQIAMVGETHRDLTARKADFVVGSVDWAQQGRAKVMGEAIGRLDVYVGADSRQILGAEMIGPRAEHIVHLLALAMTAGLTVADMLKMPVYHPTFEEGLKTALEDADDKLGSGERSRTAVGRKSPGEDGIVMAPGLPSGV